MSNRNHPSKPAPAAKFPRKHLALRLQRTGRFFGVASWISAGDPKASGYLATAANAQGRRCFGEELARKQNQHGRITLPRSHTSVNALKHRLIIFINRAISEHQANYIDVPTCILEFFEKSVHGLKASRGTLESCSKVVPRTSACQPNTAPPCRGPSLKKSSHWSSGIGAIDRKLAITAWLGPDPSCCKIQR